MGHQSKHVLISESRRHWIHPCSTRHQGHNAWFWNFDEDFDKNQTRVYTWILEYSYRMNKRWSSWDINHLLCVEPHENKRKWLSLSKSGLMQEQYPKIVERKLKYTLLICTQLSLHYGSSTGARAPCKYTSIEKYNEGGSTPRPLGRHRSRVLWSYHALEKISLSSQRQNKTQCLKTRNTWLSL